MVAVCFYSKEEYEKLLAISDDRKTMCDTHGEWFYQFMKMKNGRAGTTVKWSGRFKSKQYYVCFCH